MSFSTPRRVTAVPIVLLALALALGRGAAATPPHGASLTLRGRAQSPGGAPIARVKVTLEAARRASVTADDSGRFVITVPLPDRASIEGAPQRLYLWAAAKNWHFESEDHQTAVGLELHVESGADGIRHVVARSNDTRLAAAAASAVAAGGPIEISGLKLSGHLGDQLGVPVMPMLGVTARVALPATEVRGTSAPPTAAATPIASAPPTVAPPSPVASVAPIASAPPTAVPPSPTATAPAVIAAPAPSTNPPPPSGMASAHAPTVQAPPPGIAAADSAGGCDCRVEGTVEMSGGALTSPLRVEVGIEGQAAPADTVELYMGSPRPFSLRPVPCGERKLRVTALSRRHYAVLAPETTLPFHCERDRLVQPRLKLSER